VIFLLATIAETKAQLLLLVILSDDITVTAISECWFTGRKMDHLIFSNSFSNNLILIIMALDIHRKY